MAKHSLLNLLVLTAILTFSLQSLEAQQDLTAKEIVKKADENMRGKTSVADIDIRIIRPSCAREMNMKAWSKGDD